MALHAVPEPLRGIMALVLAALVGCFFPTYLLLIRGLSISGTQRVFLTEGTILFCTWDADNGAGGAKHRFYKIWKVSDYQVKRNSIEIQAFVWYAEKVMPRDSLPVTDGYLGDLSDIFEKAERCKREFSIRRTLYEEEALLAMLKSRKEEAAGELRDENILVDEGLRLRRSDGNYEFAYAWYQDPETVHLVDGVWEPYTREKLAAMYTWLDQHGELYFIEVREGETWLPIGDVTFGQEDMPIVIGEKAYRGRGIGKKVVEKLVERGRQLGYEFLRVKEIYDYIEASRGLFEAVGFRPTGRTAKGVCYQMDL